MSLDRSLKSGSGLGRHRNVLTRAERVERLKTAGLWKEGERVLGLPKVGNRKLIIGGKAAKKDAEADAAAPAAKGAAGAKGAAPAAKGAAPAAKGAKK
jgi:small basic protein (TIGR04137 family)